MENEKTVFDAMQEFTNISQAVAFSSNEVALFYALLQSWNAARRPAVIEQWAGVTCHASGLSDDSLNDTRNKLVQRGVIYFSKRGYRGTPKYSLNALFELPNPLPEHLPPKKRSKPRTKPLVNHGLNPEYTPDSKQEEEKDKPKIPPNPQKGEWIPDETQKRLGKLFNRRESTRWSTKEIKALKSLEVIEEDLLLIESYYSPSGSKYKRRDLITLLNNWTGEVDRARNWENPPEPPKQTNFMV